MEKAKGEDLAEVIEIRTEETKPQKKHRRFIKRNKWRRRENKKKKQEVNTNTVYNYSSKELTGPMLALLNIGLNFCVTPDKVNVG